MNRYCWFEFDIGPRRITVGPTFVTGDGPFFRGKVEAPPQLRNRRVKLTSVLVGNSYAPRARIEASPGSFIFDVPIGQSAITVNFHP